MMGFLDDIAYSIGSKLCSLAGFVQHSPDSLIGKAIGMNGYCMINMNVGFNMEIIGYFVLFWVFVFIFKFAYFMSLK